MNVQSIVSSDLTNDWRKFARALFALEDADPGYMLLHRAKLSYAQKLRYVLAWCTYYNPGIAAVASDYQGAEFYAYLRAEYATAKRASERRHFRGKAGLKALADWEREFPKPEAMIEACFADTYMGVRKNMSGMTQMGDYFYWKLADIQDTVFGKDVDFTDCEQYMPKVPKQGAAIIHAMLEGTEPANLSHEELVEVMDKVTWTVGQYRHPFSNRRLALQEAETVCCVFKQHVVGDYKLGFRSAKAFNRLKSVLAEHPKHRTAKSLLAGLYDGGIWDEKSLTEVGRYL